MAAQQAGMVLLGTIDNKVAADPVEVPGMGLGFKRCYSFPQAEIKEANPYQHDIGQIARGLAEAVSSLSKHIVVQDTLSNTPMFYVQQDGRFPITQYVVFGSKPNNKTEPHTGTIVILQDSGCPYDRGLLENFVKSL